MLTILLLLHSGISSQVYEFTGLHKTEAELGHVCYKKEDKNKCYGKYNDYVRERTVRFITYLKKGMGRKVCEKTRVIKLKKKV